MPLIAIQKASTLSFVTNGLTQIVKLEDTIKEKRVLFPSFLDSIGVLIATSDYFYCNSLELTTEFPGPGKQ